MRLASVSGRATLLGDGERLVGLDVATLSQNRFGPDIGSLYGKWEPFREWADSVDPASGTPIDSSELRNPSPSPTQVFAIGLNYYDHAAEADLVASRDVNPPIFTKFPTCLADPFASLVVPTAKVDWELELVAVIGKRAEKVTTAAAWSYVAGLAVGQDYTERELQLAGSLPQFALGKSFAGFGPIGPWLVTPDVLDDPDDLEMVCEINGEQVQKGRTSGMVWSLAELISIISAICPLLPGDVIFTGTPAGVGAVRSPARYLLPGDVVVSRIEGIGEISQTCIAPI
ncbi:fumarylacetoacetate hydrolase family protein [soil metagenome]